MAEGTIPRNFEGINKHGSLNDAEAGGSHSEAPLEVHGDEDIVARMNNLDPPVTPEEERRVRRKIDLRLPPFLLILYMFTWLDRGALGNAALMGIKEDLGFSSRDFSLAVSMFFVGTAISDLFTNIGMRYIRPSVYLATAMIIWGIFATLQAVAGGPSGMFAIRFFLGIFEAAFISGAPYLTTVLYPRAEWGRRISVYLSATPLAGAFGGWVAYGVSNISNPLIKHWQALFVIEGLVTILFGVACIWVLPDRPHNTRWLTPRERDVATWRMMRDGNRTHGEIHWRTTAAQLTGDWRLWLNIAIYMGQVLQTYTIATFTPIIVATFGYDNVKAQLMTAPPYCVAFVMVFVVGWASDRVKSCSGLLVGCSVIAAVGDLLLAMLPHTAASARYGATFLILSGILSGVTLSVGNITSNCCGDIKKGIATGLFQSFGSTMGIATGYLFPSTDGPSYKKGFWTLFAATCWTGVGAAFVTVTNIRENRRRDREFGKPPQDVVIDYDEDEIRDIRLEAIPTKTGLENLPTELLRLILEPFAAVPVRSRRNDEVPQLSFSRDNRRVLKNVSQTCQVIREAAMPLLSKNLCFFMHPSSDLELRRSNRPRNEDELAPTASEMAFLQAAAEQFGLQATDDWLQPGIQRTHVLVMMVLLQVRNIKTLELPINIKGFLRCLPTGGVEFPTRYDALMDIRLGKNTPGTSDTAGEDDPYSGSSDARRNDREWSAMDWSSVRNLHLQQLESDDVHVKELSTYRHVVHACGGLRELSICLTIVDWGVEEGGELLRHIMAHRNILRELDCAWDLLDEGEDFTAAMMAGRCRNLELLKLPESLAPWTIIERLPPSTRWLYIPADYSIQKDGEHGYSEWLNNFTGLDGPLCERVFEDGNLPNLEGVVIPAFECLHGQQGLSALKNELNKGFVLKFPTTLSLETDVAIVECKVARNVREGLFMLLTSGLDGGF
ncbi:major facilitator superfamily transporter [Colletotrichum acutatum]